MMVHVREVCNPSEDSIKFSLKDLAAESTQVESHNKYLNSDSLCNCKISKITCLWKMDLLMQGFLRHLIVISSNIQTTLHYTQDFSFCLSRFVQVSNLKMKGSADHISSPNCCWRRRKAGWQVLQKPLSMRFWCSL